jgi:4-hydroxybenzoate polyprenyltransferase
VDGALRWARGLHLLAVAAVTAAGPLAGRGPAWLAGSAVLGGVLLLEHRHVAPGGRLDPSRLNVAFFDYNAFASVAFAACALVDLWLA